MSLLAIEELEELSAPDYSEHQVIDIAMLALVGGILVGAAIT